MASMLSSKRNAGKHSPVDPDRSGPNGTAAASPSACKGIKAYMQEKRLEDLRYLCLAGETQDGAGGRRGGQPADAGACKSPLMPAGKEKTGTDALDGIDSAYRTLQENINAIWAAGGWSARSISGGPTAGVSICRKSYVIGCATAAPTFSAQSFSASALPAGFARRMTATMLLESGH